MKVEKVILKGFRSFREREEVVLSNINGAVGGNGAGKTSFLLGLNRMFGLTQKDRHIRNEDFYVTPGESLDDVQERVLSIEVKLSFPEFDEEESDRSAIPVCFRNMLVDPGADGRPYCRVRLTSTYSRDSLGDGDISTEMHWVKTSFISEALGEDVELCKFNASDRERIKVIYVPATRDPSVQLQEFSGSLIGRFVKSIAWSQDPESALQGSVQGARSQLSNEGGVKLINKTIEDAWKHLSPSFRTFRPKLSFIDDDVKKMLKNVSIDFDNGDERISSTIKDLSDGERSLFYFSLLKSALDLKKSFLQSEEITIGGQVIDVSQIFDHEKLELPSLTLLAVEEPENHLSPHHFGHLIESFKSIAVGDNSQAIFTSHSASIISRIEPEEILFFRNTDNQSFIKSLTLPAEVDVAFTYVKEAVKSYPELYFSRLVVLGEGDSEEIILRKLIEAKGMPLDRSMVSIVPLGGRFVNHFWKLLDDLGIPYITLLDLDVGKEGAGWGRVKYCIDQLRARGATISDIDSSLDEEQLLSFNEREINNPSELNQLVEYVTAFESRFSVYYSSPLDIDYMMLDKFFDRYETTIIAPSPGPTALPEDESSEAFRSRVEKLGKRIFKNNHRYAELYDAKNLNYYQYYFLSKGKPLTHKIALAEISDESLLQECPPVLVRLVDKVSSLIAPQTAPNQSTTDSNESSLGEDLL